MIAGTTKLLGVIGNPIEHSLSPLIHNRAIEVLDVDYSYLPFPIAAENLTTAIKGFEVIGVRGFSVTIPHKQAIMACLSEISATARLIGAVNTVWRKNDRWYGTNTDMEGFLAPLRKLDQHWQQTRAIVLGNGGAARAVVVGLAQLGCPEIFVLGRDQSKLEVFQQSWENETLQKVLRISPLEELPRLLGKTELLINSTPVGMYPKIDGCPIDLSLLDLLPDKAIVYDLIYTPSPTSLLDRAIARGLISIDGLEMLVQQGAAALKIWLQREDIPVEAMRQSLQEFLNKR
jgi:shikimate dehydrogenase